MKRIIILVVLIVVGVGGWYGYSEYNRKEKDLLNEKADFTLHASELVAAFEKDTASANKQYLDKVLSVTGNVKKIDAEENPVVLILGNADEMSSVKCSMDSTHADSYKMIQVGTTVSLKGRCTGGEISDMGLGTDVSLKRCVIENKK